MLFHFHVRSCKKCTNTQIGKFANAKRCWTVMSATTANQHRLYRHHSTWRWCVPCCDPAPRDFWHFCTVWLDWLAFSIKRRWIAGKRGGEERKIWRERGRWRWAEKKEKTNACPQTPPVDCSHTSMCATSTVMQSCLPLQVLMNLASRMGLSSPRRMCSLASWSGFSRLLFGLMVPVIG